MGYRQVRRFQAVYPEVADNETFRALRGDYLPIYTQLHEAIDQICMRCGLGNQYSGSICFMFCHSGCRPNMEKESVRWVFVGELHGSNEAPAAFLDLVCDALAKGKHVTVALERPISEQMALQGVLADTDLAAAKAMLLDQPEWKEGMDGRASEAMLRLLISLREFRKDRPDLAVVAFDAPFTGTSPGARDEAMGHALLSVGVTKREDVILVLTGNVHAMLSPIFH